jgi:hypothetical protein
LEVRQQIFECLFATVPRAMPLVYDYVGKELFEIYYKIAIEVDSATGDKDTSLKFLNLC